MKKLLSVATIAIAAVSLSACENMDEMGNINTGAPYTQERTAGFESYDKMSTKKRRVRSAERVFERRQVK